MFPILLKKEILYNMEKCCVVNPHEVEIVQLEHGEWCTFPLGVICCIPLHKLVF